VNRIFKISVGNPLGPPAIYLTLLFLFTAGAAAAQSEKA
jgi:hypothetical protein